MSVCAFLGADTIPIQFIGNSKAVALLLQNGIVLTWGDPAVGGKIPEGVDATFVASIHANSVGFAAIKATRKVVSWGGFPQNNIPLRIQENKGEAQVRDFEIIILCFASYCERGCAFCWADKKQIVSFQVDDILTSSQCFLALLADKTIATWGLGEQLFCNEEGARGSPDYVSYASVSVGDYYYCLNKYAELLSVYLLRFFVVGCNVTLYYNVIDVMQQNRIETNISLDFIFRANTFAA